MLNKKDGRSKLLSVFLIIVTILSLAASGYFLWKIQVAKCVFNYCNNTFLGS